MANSPLFDPRHAYPAPFSPPRELGEHVRRCSPRPLMVSIGYHLPYPWQVRLAHQASQQLFPGGGGNGGGGARMLAAAPHHLSSLDGMGLAELQAR